MQIGITVNRKDIRMQIQKIDNNSPTFGAKQGSFLQFKKTEKDINEDISDQPLHFVKTIIRMTKNKMASFYHDTKAYSACPCRFYAADDLNPERHYQIKNW